MIIEILNLLYIKKLSKQILCNIILIYIVKFMHFSKFNLTKYSDYRVFVQQRNIDGVQDKINLLHAFELETHCVHFPSEGNYS